MNNKFDELAKNMAQSITRRGALKRFGVGLAGVVLAALGLPTKAHAGKNCENHCLAACKKSPPDQWADCYSNCLDRCKHSPI